MATVTSCLWFPGTIEDALAFYGRIFPEVTFTDVLRVRNENHPEQEAGTEPTTILAGALTLAGQRFQVINAATDIRFNEAVSLIVECADQAEVDYYWHALTAEGGREGPCGWLQDQFGLSWQVVPKRLYDLLADPKTAGPVHRAVLTMRKFVLADLEAAAGGSS
ncbi:MAG: VOC family protein [Actinomycetota bacterium]